IPGLLASGLTIFVAFVPVLALRAAAYGLFLDYTFGLPSKSLFQATIKITRVPKFVWSKVSIVWLDENQVFFLYAKTLIQSLLRRSLIHSFAYIEPASITSVASWIKSLELHSSASNSAEPELQITG